MYTEVENTLTDKEYIYPFYLLKAKRFFPFFLTQFFGALNDNILKLSVLTLIAFHLVHNAQNNQLYQALGAGLFILPFLLFSSVAGQWADKYDKAILMRYVKCIEIVLMILGGIGLYCQNITWMMCSIFLSGLHSTFFGPLKYSILPEHLQEKELLAGNAFIDAGTFIAILIGNILGSLLIPENEIFLNNGLKLASFTLISIALLGAIGSFFIPSAQKYANPKTEIDWNFLKSTISLLKTSKKYPTVFSAILGISWFWFFGASLLTEFPSYVQYTLNADKNVFTLFLTLFSIGIAIGSLIVNRYLKGKISSQCTFVATLGMSLFIIDLYFASKQSFQTTCSIGLFLSSIVGWRISIDLFLLSVFGGIYITPLYAMIQKHSPPQWCSRMIAVNNIINAIFMLASALWIGVLAFFNIKITTIFLSLIVGNLYFGFCSTSHASFSLQSDTNQMNIFTKIFKKCLMILLFCLYRVEVKGFNHYPKEGKNFIVLLSYTSFLDAILLSLFLPEKLSIAVDERLIKKFWMKPFLSLINTIPVQALHPMAARHIVKATQKMSRFILAPESYVLGNVPLKRMIALSRIIIQKNNQPVLPIHISGTIFLPFSRRSDTVPRRWFPKVIIQINPLLNLEQKSETQIEHAISHQMAEMLFSTLPWKNTLFKQLLEMRSLYPKRLIAADIQKKISYNTLVLQSLVLGSCMAKQSKQGEYVGILLPTMLVGAVSFFALQAYGRIPALLNFSLGTHYLKEACKLANIKTIYTSSAFIEQAKLQEAIDTLKTLGIHVVYLEEFKEKISLTNKIEGFIRHVLSRPVSLKSSMPAVVLFTSGSEGIPKGVVLSHENLLANAYQVASTVDFSSRDLLFNALPIFHCFGLMAGMILPLTQGFSVFLYPSPLHYRLIPEWVRTARASFFLATDTFLKGYANYTRSHHFQEVRGIFAGAEKVKKETMKTWKHSFDTPVFEGYGMTEASPVIAVNNTLRNKEGSVGSLLPGISYRLEPVEGLKEGGRLWISGPNVMIGYLSEDGKVSPFSQDGWYDTGDIASIDAEGFMTLLGRARRFAKIAGEMVSFSAVETVLTSLWPEHLHAVLSKPDEKKGEELVLLTNNSEAKREIIVHYMRHHGHAEILTPKKIIILPEMPLLATGKIDYITLKKMI